MLERRLGENYCKIYCVFVQIKLFAGGYGPERCLGAGYQKTGAGSALHLAGRTPPSCAKMGEEISTSLLPTYVVSDTSYLLV